MSQGTTIGFHLVVLLYCKRGYITKFLRTERPCYYSFFQIVLNCFCLFLHLLPPAYLSVCFLLPASSFFPLKRKWADLTPAERRSAWPRRQKEGGGKAKTRVERTKFHHRQLASITTNTIVINSFRFKSRFKIGSVLKWSWLTRILQDRIRTGGDEIDFCLLILSWVCIVYSMTVYCTYVNRSFF